MKEKGKAASKATGDDIDLKSLFNEPGSGSDAELAEAAETQSSGDLAEAAEAEAAELLDGEETIAEEAEEAEAAEAADAEEVAEAEDADEAEEAEALDAEEAPEAAEAFDQEMDAADAEEAEATDDDDLADFDDDIKPVKAQGKKGKAAHQRDEDEEEEDEDASAKKKKSRKEKVAPPPPQRGRALPLIGGMFLATLLLVGGVGAAWFFALADQIADLTDLLAEPGCQAHPPRRRKPPDKTKLAKRALKRLDQQKYQDVIAVAQGRQGPGRIRHPRPGEMARLLQAADRQEGAARQGRCRRQGRPRRFGESQERPDDRPGERGPTGKRFVRSGVAAAADAKKKIDQQLADAKADKDKADKVVDAVADVLVAGKLIDDKAKFDVATLDKVVKGLNEKIARRSDKVNKLLDGRKIQRQRRSRSFGSAQAQETSRRQLRCRQ